MLPSLLLITESPSVRYFFKRTLSSQFTLINAYHELEAMQTLATTQLELIILDSQITYCDALELASKLRNKDLLTPILLITGRLKKIFRDRALDAGVSDFLSDLLDEDELETRITILERAKKERKKTEGLSAKIRQKKPMQEKSLSKRKLTPTKKELPISFKKKRGSNS